MRFPLRWERPSTDEIAKKSFRDSEQAWFERIVEFALLDSAFGTGGIGNGKKQINEVSKRGNSIQKTDESASAANNKQSLLSCISDGNSEHVCLDRDAKATPIMDK